MRFLILVFISVLALGCKSTQMQPGEREVGQHDLAKKMFLAGFPYLTETQRDGVGLMFISPHASKDVTIDTLQLAFNSLSFNGKPMVALIYGSSNAEYGYEVLMTAMANVESDLTGINIVYIGEPSQFESVEKTLSSKGANVSTTQLN